jgi:glycosyltransferase involved in cell wall biosynthesis
MPTGLVDLVIPVYNEAQVLESSVSRLRTAMEASAEFPWHIVIVDNGYIDGTTAIGERLAESFADVRLVYLSNKGRGRALLKVWTESDAQYSVYMDVDLSTDLSAVPEVVRLLQDGADVVTGSRLHSQASIRRSLKREILSRVYNRLIRWVLRTRSFDDAQCGFKGVRLESVRPLLPLIQNRNWFFDTELLVLAEYASLDVRSVPIRWIEDPDSRVNIPRTILEDLRGLWRLRRTARPLVRQWQRARQTLETTP